MALFFHFSVRKSEISWLCFFALAARFGAALGARFLAFSGRRFLVRFLARLLACRCAPGGRRGRLFFWPWCGAPGRRLCGRGALRGRSASRASLRFLFRWWVLPCGAAARCCGGDSLARALVLRVVFVVVVGRWRAAWCGRSARALRWRDVRASRWLRVRGLKVFESAFALRWRSCWPRALAVRLCFRSLVAFLRRCLLFVLRPSRFKK